MVDEETKEVLEMRLYDVLNNLAVQMEQKETSSEEIIIKAFNNHTQQYNTLTVTLQEE